MTKLVPQNATLSVRGQAVPLPSLIVGAGERAQYKFVEFFTATIRNANTREAYARAVYQFLAWCELHELRLATIDPISVAAYIESHPGSAPTVKQHLAAIRGLFDWLVVNQVVPFNPASSVKGPKHVVRKGKTPVLSPDDTRQLFDSIPTDSVAGLRDRALIGVMLYSFARVGAVIQMRVGDYYHVGKSAWLRLHEKGGKHHEVPAHHKAQEFLDAYLDFAGIRRQMKRPLFRTIDRHRQLSPNPLHRNDVNRMLERRLEAAGIPGRVSAHSWRATGITIYLLRGGKLEHAQQIASHESPRTTKLYDRTSDKISLDEIERIVV